MWDDLSKEAKLYGEYDVRRSFGDVTMRRPHQRRQWLGMMYSGLLVGVSLLLLL